MDDDPGASPRTASLAGVWLLGLLAVVPVVVPFVLSKLVTPMLVLRYTLPATIGLYPLIGRGVVAVEPATIRAVFLGVLVVGMLVPFPAYYGADQKAQWREAATFVDARTDGDDLVVVSPAWAWWPFEYYFDGGADVETADASTSARDLRGMAEGYDRAFLVFRYPDEATEARLRRALRTDEGFRPRDERSFLVVTVVEYRNESSVRRSRTPARHRRWPSAGTVRLPGWAPAPSSNEPPHRWSP